MGISRIARRDEDYLLKSNKLSNQLLTATVNTGHLILLVDARTNLVVTEFIGF